MMSETAMITPADQLPIIPERQIIEPIVQCGVLYLGTALPSSGRHGLDSIQEPFSRRYPVDGTNTVHGIDAVLSIYDNGIQLTFVRQPHAVIFYPISSLIYCASVRFSTIECDKQPLVDWRFTTLGSTVNNQSKHPPLFCLVVQRTQVLAGDECHCFITETDDTALILVRTISEVYANLKANFKLTKSPIFYQLDRYGRKISETSGIIYLSPATDNESQLNQIIDFNSSMPSVDRSYLLDPSSDGFFYRTDASIIEQWQLWDDNDLSGSRPHPPTSPFGKHQGLYHDDLTDEVHQFLTHVDDEEASTTSSCSCSSSSSLSSLSMKSGRLHRHRQDSYEDIEQFNALASNSQTNLLNSSSSKQNDMEIIPLQRTPIVIEKLMPNPIIGVPQNYPSYILEQPQQVSYPSIPVQDTIPTYTAFSDTYRINERGEKITEEGNRILFSDVIQPNVINNNIQAQSYKTPKFYAYSNRKRSKHIPVIDLQSIQNLLNNRAFKQRRKSINIDEKTLQDHHLATSDMLEIVEEYFEDHKGRKIKLNNHNTQALVDYLEPSNTKRRRSTHNKRVRRRRTHSTLNAGPSISYVERPYVRPSAEHGSIELQQQEPTPFVINNERVNEYVSNIYGTSEKKSRSPKSSSSSSSSHNHHETETTNTTNNVNVQNQDFVLPLQYMQSSINPLLLREYRKPFGEI